MRSDKLTEAMDSEEPNDLLAALRGKTAEASSQSTGPTPPSFALPPKAPINPFAGLENATAPLGNETSWFKTPKAKRLYGILAILALLALFIGAIVLITRWAAKSPADVTLNKSLAKSEVVVQLPRHPRVIDMTACDPMRLEVVPGTNGREFTAPADCTKFGY
jgi:hypothetical protein